MYFQFATDLITDHGLIIIDNCLWDGKVLEEVESKDKQTQGILAFNDFIQHDERVENLMLPIRHGLMMIRKK